MSCPTKLNDYSTKWMRNRVNKDLKLELHNECFIKLNWKFKKKFESLKLKVK